MNLEENQAGHPGIHYQTYGEGSRIVILVHGLPSSHREWDRMAQKLVANGYRVLALDLPGHGESISPKEPEFYTADTFYTHFEGWLGRLNLETPPVLIGHSFGGYLCLRYARDHQQRLSGLILINPFLAYAQVPGIVRFILSLPLISTSFLKFAPFRLIKFVLWAGTLVRRKFRIVSFLSKNELHQTALDFKRCSPNIACLPKTIGDITPNLPDVNLPAFLIWGKQDHTLAVSWYSKCASKLPNSTSKALNAGHNPHLSNFFEVYPIVLEYLGKIFS